MTTVRSDSIPGCRPSRGGAGFGVALAAALLGGAFLRSTQLPGQVIVYDEWHTLRAALTLDAGRLFRSFGDPDWSIPFALYLRAWLETVGLGGLAYRAPSWIGGLATVALAPLWVRGATSGRTAAVFAGLLAISPILVYHSRFARPYAVALPLALGAAFAAQHWWRHRDRTSALAYALLASLTAFFALPYLAFAWTPLGFFLVCAGLDARRRSLRTTAEIAALGGLVLLFCAALLGPAITHDLASLRAKLDAPESSPQIVEILRLGAGVRAGALVAFFLALCALGALSLARTSPWALAYLGTLATAQVVFVLVLAPRESGRAFVFLRYVLPALVVGLLLAAAGAVHLARAVDAALAAWRPGARRLGAGTALAASLLALALPSPLSTLIALRPQAWSNELALLPLLDAYPDPTQRLARMPAFYAELAAREPGSLILIEAPYTAFGIDSPYPWHQLRHRQITWVAAETGACAGRNSAPLPRHPGLRLDGVLFLADVEGIRRSGADYLVVHRNPPRELFGAHRHALLRRSGERCVGFARRHFGAPVFADRDIAVFALGGAAAAEPPL